MPHYLILGFFGVIMYSRDICKEYIKQSKFRKKTIVKQLIYVMEVGQSDLQLPRNNKNRKDTVSWIL